MYWPLSFSMEFSLLFNFDKLVAALCNKPSALVIASTVSFLIESRSVVQNHRKPIITDQCSLHCHTPLCLHAFDKNCLISWPSISAPLKIAYFIFK